MIINIFWLQRGQKKRFEWNYCQHKAVDRQLMLKNAMGSWAKHNTLRVMLCDVFNCPFFFWKLADSQPPCVANTSSS